MSELLIGFKRLRSKMIKVSDQIYLKVSKRRAPLERSLDFLIIGAMKSGTTALHQCLVQHPEIFMTYLKEPSWFLDEPPWLKLNPQAGSSELHKLMFKGYRQQRRVGESSTTYTEAPTVGAGAPANIHRQVPDMRFIYIVRNPFARIVSHYLHCVMHGIYAEPMVEVLKRDTTFLERSLYHFQILRYLEYFDRNRFLILFFEEFIKDPKSAMLKVCHFLDVSVDPVTTINLKQHNMTRVSSAVRDENALFDKITYEQLLGPIQEDVRALGEFMGRDIDLWDLSESRWCDTD